MALRYSTATWNGLMGSAGLKSQFDNGFVDVYTGAPPADPDQAPTGTKLGTFSVDGGGTGITFEVPTAKLLVKESTETWRMTGIAAGTAGWFRLRTSSDTGAQSTTERRVDGLVARTGGDMNMTNTVVAVGSPHTLDVFQIGPA